MVNFSIYLKRRVFVMIAKNVVMLFVASLFYRLFSDIRMFVSVGLCILGLAVPAFMRPNVNRDPNYSGYDVGKQRSKEKKQK